MIIKNYDPYLGSIGKDIPLEQRFTKPLEVDGERFVLRASEVENAYDSEIFEPEQLYRIVRFEWEGVRLEEVVDPSVEERRRIGEAYIESCRLEARRFEALLEDYDNGPYMGGIKLTEF